MHRKGAFLGAKFSHILEKEGKYEKRLDKRQIIC